MWNCTSFSGSNFSLRSSSSISPSNPPNWTASGLYNQRWRHSRTEKRVSSKICPQLRVSVSDWLRQPCDTDSRSTMYGTHWWYRRLLPAQPGWRVSSIPMFPYQRPWISCTFLDDPCTVAHSPYASFRGTSCDVAPEQDQTGVVALHWHLLASCTVGGSSVDLYIVVLHSQCGRYTRARMPGFSWVSASRTRFDKSV